MARWIVGGIGALLVVVLYFLWNSTNDEQRSSVDRATKTKETPSDDTENKLTSKITKHLAPRVRSDKTDPGQVEADESKTAQKNKTIEMARPKPSGPLKILKSVYEDEARDPTAEETEKLIRNEFGTDHLPIEFLHNVRCHKSVCKVEMYWSEKEPLVLMAFTMKTGSTLTSYIAFDPEPEPGRDGRTFVAVYVLREGEISDL